MTELIHPVFTGWTLIASGIVWLLQLVFVTLLYIVGGPFGALSDFSNALAVLLLLPFALALHRINQAHAAAYSWVALLIGVVGIFTVAVPSILILVGRINFQQSLPPIIAGFAAIGVWLLVSFWILMAHGSLPPNLTRWGLVIGLGLASTGLLLTVSGSNPLLGGDSKAFFSNPLLYPAFILVPLGVLGYPFWAVGFGRLLALRVIRLTG
jgi:hypothetical protein